MSIISVDFAYILDFISPLSSDRSASKSFKWIEVVELFAHCQFWFQSSNHFPSFIDKRCPPLSCFNSENQIEAGLDADVSENRLPL